MVPIERIFEEMEKQLRDAKNSSDESRRREALAAIRSLADVALGDRPKNGMPEVKPLPLSAPQATMTAPAQDADGANGNSIFDF
ncbi:YwdI family protein [Bhargavaea ullalensis]|uniref:YwdI family protein n=2 Tax=Bhargavaea ullalensis TaxID=1265685 RepID=A0ABV2GBZ1_9BACL